MAIDAKLLLVILGQCMTMVWSQQEVKQMYEKTFTGDATYYGPTYSPSRETCQLRTMMKNDPRTYGLTTVAMNVVQFAGSMACGMCLKVTGSGKGSGLNPLKGDYLVYVTDLCPGCKKGDIDFAVVGDGRWDISSIAVPCPFTGSFAYRFQGSNAWYVKIQVGNARLPAMGMALFNSNTNSYIPMKRTSDGFWIMNPNNIGAYKRPVKTPIKVQLTSITGEVVTDVINGQANDVTYSGGAQFTTDP